MSQTSSENTALGAGSLYHDTTASDYSATGFTAMFNATTAIRNTVVGTGAGVSLINGNCHPYLG